MPIHYPRWIAAFCLLLLYTSSAQDCESKRFEGCDSCVAIGCVWCTTLAECTKNETHQTLLLGYCNFTATCNDPENAVFTDPLAASQKWVYDLINVEPVWRAGYTGKGIGIRVNDDGVDDSHPEFQGRFDRDSSCSVYLPADLTQTHGTFVAGLAAGGGNNGECAVGIAPGATVSACRVVSEGNPLAVEVSTVKYLYKDMENMDISQNSYGVSGCGALLQRRRLQNIDCPFQSVKGSPCETCGTEADWSSPGAECQALIAEYCGGLASLEVNDVEACFGYLELFSECKYTIETPDEETALRRGISEGRGKKGIIYVFASGNDREYGSDVNMEGFLTSRYTISVGGVERNGTHTPFAIGGSALFIVAPAGSLFSSLNTISALAGGGCGDEGSGTSFSAPLVAGVIALMLEANPALTWRDVQGILATTSRRANPDDSSWTINAAGFQHSDLYGFGIVDAEKAVLAAEKWKMFTPEWELKFDSDDIDISLPELLSVNSTVQVSAVSTFFTESVSVFIDVDHGTRGDLEITLVSPLGTESILHPGKRPENSQIRAKWKFMTLKTWGENPSGTWTLTVVDKVEGNLETCVDYEWALSDGNGDFWTCNDVSGVPGDNICENGGEGPLFRDIFKFADSLNYTALQDDKGITPGVGCCECGGGRMSSAVRSTLVSWSIAIYGHDPNDTMGPSTEEESASASMTAILLSLSLMLWPAFWW